MEYVPIEDAERRLESLAGRVQAGETVIVTQNGSPVFEMVPPGKRGGLDLAALRAWKRQHGYPDRIVTYVAADFDDPLPEDFLITPQP